MKLVVIVPTADYVENAGARIRYARLIDGLASHGVELTIEPIASVMPASLKCDVALFSKCHDARSVICARALSKRGVLVGVDLFDDYFSQRCDSRLNRLRSWLDQMLRASRFALASTPLIAQTIRRFAPDLPIHILNDPAPNYEPAWVSRRLTEKRSEVLASGRLQVAWFGMGDNPLFSTGLVDLAAFGSAVSLLATEFAIDLTILTNRRSLHAAGLERVASLPIRAKVEEWTEQKEAEILRSAAVSFLPVGSSPFSRSKSLNRAVTALCSGCQVLTAGYPLYAPLGAFLYRQAAELLDHLRENKLRLSPPTLAKLQECLAELASTNREVTRLLSFIEDHRLADPLPAEARGAIFLIHGAATVVGAHHLVKALGGLSVASPFCSAPLAFDIIFRIGEDGALIALAAKTAMLMLTDTGRKLTSRPVRLGGRKYWELSEAKNGGVAAISRDPLIPLQLAAYASTMSDVANRLCNWFGAMDIILSEQSTLPYDQSRFTCV